LRDLKRSATPLRLSTSDAWSESKQDFGQDS
jgi:hypothetical protein